MYVGFRIIAIPAWLTTIEKPVTTTFLLRNCVDISSVFALIYALVLNVTVFQVVKMEAVATTFEVVLDLAALYFANLSSSNRINRNIPPYIHSMMLHKALK